MKQIQVQFHGVIMEGADINAEDVIDEATAADTADGQPLDNFNVIWPSTSNNIEPLKFQIGANAGIELRLI